MNITEQSGRGRRPATAVADSARPSRSGAPSAREPPAPAHSQPPSSPGLRPHCARLPSAFGAFPWAHAANRRLATLSTWSAAFAGTRQGEIGWRPRWGLTWVRGGPPIPKAPPGPPHQERLGKAGRAHSPRHRHAEWSARGLLCVGVSQNRGGALPCAQAPEGLAAGTCSASWVFGGGGGGGGLALHSQLLEMSEATTRGLGRGSPLSSHTREAGRAGDLRLLVA